MASDVDALAALGLQVLKDKSDQAQGLIAGMQLRDPKLFEALTMMFQQLGAVTVAISPIAKILTTTGVRVEVLTPPTSFSYITTPTTIRLSWVRPAIVGILSYEIRMGGADWDHAFYVIRTNGTTIDVPPFVGLTETFRIKTLNDVGGYSADEATVLVTIIPPGAVTISAQVIDNNILLQWSVPTVGSFAIDYYEIQRDTAPQGNVSGTFISFFEVVSGSYLYTIVPVDIAGNRGTSAGVTLLVNQPPDYVLQDSRISTWTGTLVNAIKESNESILACIVTPQTFQAHFTTHAWLTPQNQVTAGFPIYIQPTAANGSYKEVIDYGAILNNVIATYTFQVETLVPDITIVLSTRTSTDGVSWTAPQTGASIFIPTVRYLEITFLFTNVDATNDHGLIRVSNLQIFLNVKREVDSGAVLAVSTDATGTQVNFNKDYKDIDSITCSVDSAKEPFTVIYDFVDIPDPVGFKVFVFDTTGNRVTKLVSWKARGIV